LISFVPLASVATADIEHLLDLAFGSDRYQRTAYKLRAGLEPIAALSFAALQDGVLVGSIQCWPVQLTGSDGHVTPLILVGPVAVHPDHQRAGIGRKLMQKMLKCGEAADSEPMMLIGDAIYYDRFFGFSARHTRGWTLSAGPVERDRLLALLRPGQTVPSHAALGPRRTEAPSLIGSGC
jgi:predicted N-acetyltransferase YhbS